MIGALIKFGGKALAKQYAKAFPKTVLGRALGGGLLKTTALVGTGAAAGAMLPQQKGGLPAVPGMGPGGVMTPGQFQPVGFIPWWRGPGGKLQFPWQDPNVPQFLKSFALDDAYLRPYYRAPRGYVVVRDPNGKPYAIMKHIAKQFGLWRPKSKPPISVRDWHAFQAAKRVEKKLRKIAAPALRRYSPRGGCKGGNGAVAFARASRKR